LKTVAIIPAAGAGTRYSKTKPKLLENLDGLPVIVHTLKKISAINEIETVIVCTSQDLIGEISVMIKNYKLDKVKEVILGGETRQKSVFLGLQKAKQYNPDFVLIHDGARPLVTKEILQDGLDFAKEKGTCIVGVPAKDTIKQTKGSSRLIKETLNRSELWNIQTPQIFKFSQIIDAHEKFKAENFTDDSALVEKLGIEAYVFEGSYKNIKITTGEDLLIAKIFMK